MGIARRKTFLLTFAFIGSISTILFAAIRDASTCITRDKTSIVLHSFNSSQLQLTRFLLFCTCLGLFWFAGVLVIISNVSFGASWVLYYAFIPTLARDHPDVVNSRKNVETGVESWAEHQVVKDKVTNTLSSHSMAIGYAAGVSLLIVAAGIALGMDQTTYSMQLGMALVGVWWLLLSFFPLKYMAAQPGQPLVGNVNLFFYSWRRRKSEIAP